MTRLFITVDSEVCVYDPAVDTPDTQIWGATRDGMNYGITFIMDELASRGWTCTFFLNVYDSELWGEQAIAEIARTILARGFDLQLHTHVYGEMSVHSFKEQCRLIREGSDRLQEWTGIRPIWHRAGNLSANRDTLRACAAEGFVGDSSYLYGWPQCAQIGATSGWRTSSTALYADSEETRLRNQLRDCEGVLEVPVTTFRTLPVLRNYRHLDIDACTFQELISIVRQAVKKNVSPVVLLMHSFSFVRRTECGYVPHDANIRKFRRLLETLKVMHDVSIETVCTLREPLFDSPEFTTGLVLTYHRAWAHFNRSWKHKLIALLPLLLSGVVMGLWILCR